jgi:ankyrin repeat protein
MNKLIVVATLLISAQTSLADINSEIINAATEGQTETLKTLISGSADVQSDGRSALISAAFSAIELQGKGESYDGQVEAVQILVTAGVDVDEHLDNGLTALMLMAILGQTDAVHVLLDAGADVNAVASADGSTALIFAVYGGTTEIVSTLIEAGANVDMVDTGTGSGDGRTALSYAKEKDHAEIIDVLKQAGAK